MTLDAEKWLGPTDRDCLAIVQAYLREEGVDCDLVDRREEWSKVGDGLSALDKLERLDVISSTTQDGRPHVSVATTPKGGRCSFALSSLRLAPGSYRGFHSPAWSIRGVVAVYRHASQWQK